MSKILSFIKNTGIVWKSAIGSALAWKVAHIAGSTHPYLAPITLLLCLQATLNQSIHFAIYRVFGTALGILITVMLASYFSLSYLTIGLFVFIGTTIGKIFKMSFLVIHQVALSILLVFTFASKSPDYGIDRLRDTVVGALIAFVLSALIFPIDLTKKATEKFSFYTNELISSFSDTAEWVANGCDIDEGDQLHKGTQQLLKDLHQLGTEIDKAIKNLYLNPYSKKQKKKLTTLKKEVLHLSQGYSHISGMLRSLMEWTKMDSMTDYDHALWSSYFYSLSAYIDEWKNALNTKEGLGGEASFTMSPPPEMEKSRFNFSLYNDAIQLITDFKPTIPTRA